MELDWWEWEQYFQDLYDEIEKGEVTLLEDSVGDNPWSESALAAFAQLKTSLPDADEFPYALFASIEEFDESDPMFWPGPVPVGDTDEARGASLLTGPGDWNVTVVEDPSHGRIHVFYSCWDEHLALYLLPNGQLGEFSPV